MWNNGMFNPMRPRMPPNPNWSQQPTNQNWAPPNYQQQFNQWPMNQQWSQPRMPPNPYINTQRWNQPRMPANSFSQPPPPPLPANGRKAAQTQNLTQTSVTSQQQQPPPPKEQHPQPPKEQHPLPPKEQQPPPPPLPTEKDVIKALPKSDATKDMMNKKGETSSSVKTVVKKLNLSAPPPPPPPAETKPLNSNQNLNSQQYNSESVNFHGKSSFKANYVKGRGSDPDSDSGSNSSRGQHSKSHNTNDSKMTGTFNRSNNQSFQSGNNFGNRFYQDDNSEYDDGFTSHYDDMDVETFDEAEGHNDNNQSFDQQETRNQHGNSHQTPIVPDTTTRNKDLSKNETTIAEEKTQGKQNSNILEGSQTSKNNGNGNQKLENFDKMFQNWEENYAKWKTANAENPDREYVRTYMAQMDAMRIQLLEKRKGLDIQSLDIEHVTKANSQDSQDEESRKQKMVENWQSHSGEVKKSFLYAEDTEVKQDISAKELAQKILDDASEDSDDEKTAVKENDGKVKRSRWGNDEKQQEQKRSRWEIDPSDVVDIQDWRRRPDNESHGVSDQQYNQYMGGRQGFTNSNFPVCDSQRPMCGQFNNQQMFETGQGNKPPMYGRMNQQGYSRGMMNTGGRGRGMAAQHNTFAQLNQGKASDYESYWKPTAVTDYSQRNNTSNSKRDVFVQREFKPQTFDYSHGAQKTSSPANKQRFCEKTSNSFSNTRNSPIQTINARDRERFQTPPPKISTPPVKPEGNHVMVDSIISLPGRAARPPKIVIILRGLPGSGKSHLAKLIKEKEIELGGEQPRTLALDDYFDCDGKYEFDAEMEDLYRSNLIKSFKKNIDGGYFKFLIVDAVNSEVDHFRSMWSHAKQNGFEVYICGVECDAQTAAARNVHERTEKDVLDLASSWEETPPHMNTLDVRALLQDDAIEHFEMGEASDDVKEDTSEISQTKEDEEEEDQAFLRASKWEILDKEEKMAKLDGTTEKLRSKLAEHHSIEDWLELGDEYNKPARQGKKRVRWADIEQRKTQARVKELGFVVGQTNWNNQRDVDSAANKALASTKIIPNRFQSEFHN